jgi:anti-sigma factor (TIGR02949 family)
METGKHKDDCKEVFALLSEYLDAELNPENCEEIKQHLAGCPPCIEFLESLKRTVSLCHDCEPADQPPPLSPADREKLLAAYRKSIGK